MIRALLARGVGKIRTVGNGGTCPNNDCTGQRIPPDRPDGECRLAELNSGSGVLTSDITMMTAHHVVYPNSVDLQETPCEAAKVSIEASVERWGEVRGGFFENYRFVDPNSPIITDALEARTDNKFDATPLSTFAPCLADADCDLDHLCYERECVKFEENPLLANRLFAIGLETWATDKSSLGGAGVFRRNALHRNWPFRIAADNPKDVDDAFSQQNMVRYGADPMRNQGYDIAFLAACEHTQIQATRDGNGSRFSPKRDNPGFTPSGQFEVSRPGVFFNIAPPLLDVADSAFFDYRFFGEEGGQHGIVPSIALHSNQWPETSNRADAFNLSVPLVSRPGYIRQDYSVPSICAGMDDPSSPGNEASMYYCADPAEQRPGLISYRNPVTSADDICTRSTHDVASGSSGGLVLARPHGEFGRTLNYYSVGVVHSSKPNEREEVLWDAPIEPGTTGTELPGVVPEDNFITKVIRTPEPAVIQATRTHPGPGGTPFDPRPARCVDKYCGDTLDPTKPDCGPFGLKECTNSTSLPEFGDIPPLTTLAPPEAVSYGAPPDESSAARESDFFEENNVPYGFRLTFQNLCDFSDVTPDKPWGMAIGLVGGKTELSGTRSHCSSHSECVDPEVCEDQQCVVPAGVGNLRVVCAPWTSLSWDQNWMFLKVIGRFMPRGSDSFVSGFSWWRAYLHELLRYAFEKREAGGTETYRPISMKLCPPNFVMTGMYTHVVNPFEPENVYLAGVSHLICERPKLNPAPAGYPDKACVSLSPDSMNAGLAHCPPASGTNFKTCLENGDCYDDFTIKNRPFSLDQMIGNSTLKPNLVIRCAPGQALSGFSFSAFPIGAVRGFWPHCVDMP